MPTVDEIQSALRAKRAVPLNVPNPHGPLGLEHLRSVVDQLSKAQRNALAIQIRPETRLALERLAIRESSASFRLTPADIAAAIVEEAVSSGQF